MQYRGNKFRTLLEIHREVDNWLVAFAMRLFRKHAGLNLLRFKRGLNLICRGGNRDWDVVHELFFAGGYRTAFDYLRSSEGEGMVLDLGGNIGCFSLLAAECRSGITVRAFEPGPPNARLFRMNQLANSGIGSRIELVEAAVAGRDGEITWFFDEENPGGSGLFADKGIPSQVKIHSFSEVIESITQPILLVKIDIEGSEYDLLQDANEAIWQKIPALSLELHNDPAGKVTRKDFLNKMENFGYRIREESVCSYFLIKK